MTQQRHAYSEYNTVFVFVASTLLKDVMCAGHVCHPLGFSKMDAKMAAAQDLI